MPAIVLCLVDPPFTIPNSSIFLTLPELTVVIRCKDEAIEVFLGVFKDQLRAFHAVSHLKSRPLERTLCFWFEFFFHLWNVRYLCSGIVTQSFIFKDYHMNPARINIFRLQTFAAGESGERPNQLRGRYGLHCYPEGGWRRLSCDHVLNSHFRGYAYHSTSRSKLHIWDCT